MASYLAVAATVAALTILVVVEICRAVWWRPKAVTKILGNQGILGPKYSLFSGNLNEIRRLSMEASRVVLDTNSNDITCTALPHYHKWSSEYGKTFLYWFQTKPRICISDPELAKQILSNKFGFYVKPQSRPSVKALVGEGLALVNGLDWVRRRRILNPAFSIDKLKVMVKRIAACAISKLDEWEQQAVAAEDCHKKIEMCEEFRMLTADIIAHTAFGSSFAQGREAFKAQQELQKYCAKSLLTTYFPGSRYIPTPSNIQMWKLHRKIKNSLGRIIKSRINSKVSDPECPYGDDLLGLLIGSSESIESKVGPKLNMDEIMEECKTFFFAGHETTSNLLTWTVFLLSIHQDWQARLREEVLKECGMEIPDADMLAKLKLVNMVLLEALRLYCPVIQLGRDASEDMKLGNLMIPKGTCLIIPIIMIHRSKQYWGEDANNFNPLRFINGVSQAAKHPNALLAFAIGPRACIGQNFAMLEAKTVLSLMLQRFSFSLSPEYVHAPINNVTLQPKYGLPIIINPLQH